MRFAHSWLYVNTLRSSERTWPSHRGNATSLPCPGRRALGQAESSVGKGDGVFPKNPGKGRKVSEGRMQGAEGTSLLWPRGSRKLEEMPKGKGGAGSCWRRHLEVAGPSFTDLSVRTP